MLKLQKRQYKQRFQKIIAQKIALKVKHTG